MLLPISPEWLAWQIENLDRHRQIADSCRQPVFSSQLRDDLQQRLGGALAVDLVEIVARVGAFDSARTMRTDRRDANAWLRELGHRQKRGKRPTYGLPELVSAVTPVMLHFGVPLRTGEGSVLVVLLRKIAGEMAVSGDPRDELRRLQKLASGQRRITSDAIAAAVVKGLSHFKVNPP